MSKEKSVSEICADERFWLKLDNIMRLDDLDQFKETINALPFVVRTSDGRQDISLYKHHDTGNNMFYLAYTIDAPKIISYMLDNCFLKLDDKDEWGNNFLHYAAGRFNNEENIRKLYELDRRYPAIFHLTALSTNFFLEIPIHIAVQQNKLENVKTIIEMHTSEDMRALLDARDWEGCTPLYRAVQGGHLELAQYLYKWGAHISTQSRYGVTLLQATKDKGMTEAHDWLTNKYKTLGVRYIGA